MNVVMSSMLGGVSGSEFSGMPMVSVSHTLVRRIGMSEQQSGGCGDVVPAGALTVAGVAARLGVQRRTVEAYRHHTQYGFPEPDGRLGRTPWWKPATIDAWQKGRPGQGRGGGRPRKTNSH